MIQAVLFDLGGTIHTVTNTPERSTWFGAFLLDRLKGYGIEIDKDPADFITQLKADAEVYKKHVEETRLELPCDQIWNDYYLKRYDIPREQLTPISEELSFLYDYLRPINMRRPHLIETMEELKGMGMRLGVISNIISHDIVPHFMMEYGLDKYMECVITSADVLWRKPAPEIFRVAEQKMQLKPEDFAYVGDTLSRDVRGVRAAGWNMVIQIEHQATAHRDVGLAQQGISPDYLIRDLSEIPAIIRAANGI